MAPRTNLRMKPVVDHLAKVRARIAALAKIQGVTYVTAGDGAGVVAKPTRKPPPKRTQRIQHMILALAKRSGKLDLFAPLTSAESRYVLAPIADASKPVTEGRDPARAVIAALERLDEITRARYDKSALKKQSGQLYRAITHRIVGR